MINISTFKDPPITTHIKLKPHKTHQNKFNQQKNQRGIQKRNYHSTNLWSKASSEAEPSTMRACAASRSSAKSFSSSPTARWNIWGWFWRTALRNFPTMERGSSGEFRLLNSHGLAPALALIKGLRLWNNKQEEEEATRTPPPPPPRSGLVKNLKWGLWEIEGRVRSVWWW